VLSFERPLFILAGILLFAAVLGISRFRRSVLSVSIPLGPPGGESFTPPVGADLSVKLIRFAEFAGACCFVAALAGPVSVSTEAVYLDRGADIVFVIDASPSMSALDMDGLSRFKTAKRLGRGLLRAGAGPDASDSSP
jgi:Ca-activated chloride channel family protein